MRHRLVGALVALHLAGCSTDSPKPAPAETSEETRATASAAEEARATTEVATPAPATATAEVVLSVSGRSPAVAAAPNSASAQPSANPRAAALSAERAKMEREMLRALSNAGPAGDRPRLEGAKVLVDDAVPSNAGRGGLGDLHVGGGGAGLAGVDNSSGGPSIAGKPVAQAKPADLEKALVKAGCTATRADSPSTPPSPTSIFTAKCGERSFVVTLIEKGGAVPGASAIAEMEKQSAVFHEEGILLSVKPAEGADLSAARTLLDKLVSRNGSAGSKVSGPRGSASIGGASVSGGSIDNAGAVVAGMAAGFRRCYQRGLDEDPEMKGSLRITAEVGPQGEVKSAKAAGGGGLSQTVIRCAELVVSSRTFGKPEGGKATVVIPITYVPQ